VNRLRKEMKIIPPAAWAVAVALTLCVTLLYFWMNRMMFSPESHRGFFFPVLFIGVLIAVSLFVYSLLIGYIATDARRRGMRVVLWTLLAIFIPNAIGIILYFILREPLLRPCPRCGAAEKATFPYCSACGASLAGICPSCQNAVEPNWTHCARCGAKLGVPLDSPKV